MTITLARRAIGLAERGLIASAWNNKCAYCEDQATTFEIDHIVPHADGGSCDLENLCLSCKSCNRRKGFMRLPKLYEGLLLKIASKNAKVIRKKQVTPRKFWGSDAPASPEIAVFGIKHVKKYFLPKAKGETHRVTQDSVQAHFADITLIVNERAAAKPSVEFIDIGGKPDV
jgi:hypothetical protein